MIIILIPFAINAFIRNDLESVLLFLFAVLAFKYLPKEDVKEFDVTPIQIQLDDLNERFNSVQALADETKKQINLHSIKSGFKMFGKNNE